MGQRPRDNAPGIHHVIVQATGNGDYYADHIDRLDWLRRFILVLDRYGWRCLIVCQMTTHVHAVVDVPDRSLSEGMQRLNCGYGKEFNARHERRGNLLGARFWSERSTTAEQLLATFRYVALNPVRAGICERAEEWFWSSFATSCGFAKTFPFVDAGYVSGLLDPAEGTRQELSSDSSPLPDTATSRAWHQTWLPGTSTATKRGCRPRCCGARSSSPT